MAATRPARAVRCIAAWRAGHRSAASLHIEIYALDTKLDITPGADAFETRTKVMAAIQGHVLGKAVYVRAVPEAAIATIADSLRGDPLTSGRSSLQ